MVKVFRSIKRRQMMDPVEYFSARIRIASSGCWEWTGTKGAGGYGQMNCLRAGTRLAHRYSFEAHKGCLSVRVNGKLFRMNVRRSRQVVARWLDENRQEHTRRLGGLDAIVAQHESEHLDGKCIVDRLDQRQLEHEGLIPKGVAA